jgi:hypothetical protein
LEEVLSPKLLETFHENYYAKNTAHGKSPFLSYERVHNKAIFDSINEGINIFRPYFIINGQPYPWSQSEKALTYYFIREDCVDELLEKVELEVLRWCSGLCGLIVPEACQPIQRTDSVPLSI